MSKKTTPKKHAQTTIRSYAKVPHLLIAVALLLFFITAISGVYYRLQLVAQQTKTDYPLQVWQQGEIVVDDRFAFSFNSVRTDTKDIPRVWELPSGFQYVMVNVSFKNTTTNDYHLSPIKSMHIQDEQNRTYDVTSAPTIKNSLGGPVKTGQTVTGEVGFTLPVGVTKGSFIFNPNLPDAHQIRVQFSL
jgi:hypothetical protein